ncbi:MAG TPA: glycosyltransferase [Solirubrobacteraceae bacterium]|nr:glycosyltransferase [Solirubrobacteraceae bacterium]
MTPTASIVIPTRARPDYLEVALASIAPQASAAGADLLVVEDDHGSSPATRALAERFGARYLSHPRPLGLNAARNTAIANSRGELLVFVDDDVEVHPGWLGALLRAAREHPHVQVFTGPIRPRLEGRRGLGRHTCGREGPPITALDLGPQDTPDVRYAWGANMTVRRRALERIGPFDAALGLYGDEQEWQDRLFAEPRSIEPALGEETGLGKETSGGAAGNGWRSADRDAAQGREGRILYVADAVLDHRRSPADARLRALAKAAYFRGQASRRFDVWRGEAPTVRRELRTLAGCVAHVVRRRCPAGLTMVAHSFGRVEGAVRESTPRPARGRAGEAGSGSGPRRRGSARPTDTSRANVDGAEDFLSGESGTVGGLDAARREVLDRLIDARELLGGRRLCLARAARRSPPRRRVLVLGVERPERSAMSAAIRAELARSRHDVELRFRAPGDLGKFENLNLLLAPDSTASPNGKRDPGAENTEYPVGAKNAERSDGEHAAIQRYDWLLVIDDDVVLPRGFLDRLLLLAERFQFDLLQPAHRARSHAAWRVTRRRAHSVARETPFVEIGPVTAFARTTFPALLPFPPGLRMGWGLDLHWAALARQHGWRCGVLDALAIRHSAAPAGDAYSRQAAIAEGRALLAERPYLKAREAQTTLLTHRRW